MKKLICSIIILTLTLPILAQTNDTARLALIAESPDASPALDVLTAELSSHTNLQLLERSEIDKVYQEQSLSAGNRDYVKLGQILGADGLLLMDIETLENGQTLNVRLVAVKPGVVLVAEKFKWPIRNLQEWSPIFSRHLDLFLPKLTVPLKDAIPISVVNLRSAISSGEGMETEKELKLLTIQRLSQERQFFVLERQRMELLGEEKDLKQDDSPFWNGSYLLEGVVDQNGYSKDTITIDVTLTPKGSLPIQLSANGSRTNPVEVIDGLTEKIKAALKLNSTAIQWNAGDEAAHYYEEAQWALRWGDLKEAQMAADAAWALGKHDMDCAIIQVKAYDSSIEGMMVEKSDFDREMLDSGMLSDRDWAIRYIKKTSSERAGMAFEMHVDGLGMIEIHNAPDQASLDHVIYALNRYKEFSQTLPSDQPKPNTDWYNVGIECLTQAAKVLQHYYLVPSAQGGANEKLHELRELARSVDEWIGNSPSVQESYFHISSNLDDQRRVLMYTPNLYHCEINWGSFWQETPEACIVLYSNLMSSQGFACFNEEFGSSKEISYSRPAECARLISWNAEDRRRVPAAWDNYIQVLASSTNAFLRSEAVEFKDTLGNEANEEEILDQYAEYWKAVQMAKVNAVAPEDENGDHSSDFIGKLYTVFRTGRNSDLALELEPQLLMYRTNLVTMTQTKSGMIRHNLMLAIAGVDRVQRVVNEVLQQTAPKPTPTPIANSSPAAAQGTPAQPATNQSSQPAGAANYLMVKQFFGIPQEQIRQGAFVWPGEESRHGINNEEVVSHAWREGKLLLGIKYECNYNKPDGSGSMDGKWGAAALLDPKTSNWNVVLYPQDQSRDYISCELFHGCLYVVADEHPMIDNSTIKTDEKIFKYDLKEQKWNHLDLEIPQTGNIHLFAVNNHLFAANRDTILEITDGGKGDKILASNRRQPAVSALDTWDNMGSPLIFPGPNDTIQTCIWSKLFSWDGTDWKEQFDFEFGGMGARLEIGDDGVIFRKAGSTLDLPHDDRIWILPKGQSRPELCIGKKQNLPAEKPAPLWPQIKNASLIISGAAIIKSNLLFFDDHTKRKIIPNGIETTESKGDGCLAWLVNLDRSRHRPLFVPLGFDWRQGRPPLSNQDPWSAGDTWLQLIGNTLYIGQPDTPGIWAMPVSDLESYMDKLKQTELKRDQAASTGL